MNPQTLTAWINVAQVLASVGINIVTGLKAMLHIGHPALSDAEIEAAYTAILADDTVRAAFADSASHPPAA